MIVAFVLDLGVSDVCHGWPGILPYVLTQAAHATSGADLVIAALGFAFATYCITNRATARP